MWTFQSRLLLLLHTFHPTSEWPPSNSKSWMEVISVRFHASQQSSRVSVFSPSSREVASWTVNLPSCRHCLNVVEWNNVEMIVEMNPGGRSPNRKNHNMDFTFTLPKPMETNCWVTYIRLDFWSILWLACLFYPCSLPVMSTTLAQRIPWCTRVEQVVYSGIMMGKHNFTKREG